MIQEKLIHYSNGWIIPAWNKTQKDLPCGVYEADDGRLYSFNKKLITCILCKEKGNKI